MIQTIRDLQNASPAEIAKAKKSINFKGWVTEELKRSSHQPGMTYEQWQEAYDNRRPMPCKTCHGKGDVMPHMRTVGTIHASSATACVTKLYYDVTGEIAPVNYIPPELQFVFAIGHTIHALVQDALHRALGDAFRDEVRVDLPEALILNGSCDGVAELPLCRSGLEIKTISENDFGKLRKPKSEHLTQASGLYSKGLDLPFMSYLYVSKGWPHSMKEYVVPYDEKVFLSWYRKKGRKVEEGLEDDKPPIADATSYECKSCGYRRECPQVIGVRDAFRRS